MKKLEGNSENATEKESSMGDSKRWTVTYTTHIKQKRKLYQDGFLQLQISTNKVALYDECDQLLECRLLKKAETVASGETLEFNRYLVDIGDPEGHGHDNPQSALKVETKHTRGSTFSTPSKNTKINAAKANIKQTRKPLSPSQQIIKEFKKRELLKYSSPQISPETTKPSTSEFQVLYTTQVTQKAKKYHDGFLRLAICGSRGGQVMLFDASRKLLDSRFLKKDDVIRPGESIALDAYLIDIGEHQENHKPDCSVQRDIYEHQENHKPDCSVQRDNCTKVDRVKKMDRQHTSLDTDTDVAVGKSEWHALYTTQLKQKSKKYQDGLLQLEFCGSRGRQVVLYDSTKRPLERRFLKKDEVIKAGESVYFDGHLVDVGEPVGRHKSPMKLNEQGTGNTVLERRILTHGHNGCLKANPSVSKGQPPRKPSIDVGEPVGRHQSPMKLNEQGTGNTVLERRILTHGHNGCLKANPSVSKGQPPRKPSIEQETGLNSNFPKIEEKESNRIVPPVKPLRDANQILSFLQDPMLPDRCEIGGRPPNRSCHNILDSESTETMKSSDAMYPKAMVTGGLHFDGECQNVPPVKEAQTDKSEADVGLFISNAADNSSCVITNEGNSAEELSSMRETFPSFDLGF